MPEVHTAPALFRFAAFFFNAPLSHALQKIPVTSFPLPTRQEFPDHKWTTACIMHIILLPEVLLVKEMLF